jgi:hypothetical protein
LRLDLGCGPNKKEGFLGVDSRPFDGKVDVVHDLTTPWPWDADSVEEVHCSHFIEHLDGRQRAFFWSELWRVMKTGAKATVIAPHWCSNRAYGDPTHAWPPVSEMSFYYLSRAWRAANAPHTDDLLRCDFEATWGYSMHPALAVRNPEYQQHQIQWSKEAAQDIIATVTKKA